MEDVIEETGEETAPEETDLEEDEFDLDLGEGTPTRDDSEEREEPPEGEEEDEKPPDLDNKLKELEDRLAAKEQHITNLNKALHQERQSKKEKKSDDVTLTDDQLLGIMREHKDDPDTMFNVFKYLSKQGSKDAEQKAVDASRVAQQKKEFDSRLGQAFPDLYSEGSELRTNVDTVKESLGVVDHPFGDLFAMGAISLNNLDAVRKAAYEQGKKDALGEKAENTRKDKLKKNALTPPGSGSAKPGKVILTPQQRETAKGLGLTSKAQQELYASMLKKKES